MPNPINEIVKYEDKPFQTTLKRYLKQILGSLHCVALDRLDAIVLQETDSEERYVHVQFHDLETGEPLDPPLVWNKKDWLSAEHRVNHNKRVSELRRNAAVKQTENINKVMRYLHVNLHLNDEKLARYAAEKMILEGDCSMLEALGLTLNSQSPEEKKALGEVIYINPLKKL